jgi:hypothetical protein
MGYETDIGLERRFAVVIKAILGNCFIDQDPVHDKREGTDFEVFTVRPFKVGVRLRRYCYLARYGNEFTLRWSRPSGVPTEIHKVREGLVDFILYGFVDADQAHIVQWFLGDLAVFRAREPKPIAVIPNDPYDSDLAAFRVSDLPAEFVVRSWSNATPAPAFGATRGVRQGRMSIG